MHIDTTDILLPRGCKSFTCEVQPCGAEIKLMVAFKGNQKFLSALPRVLDKLEVVQWHGKVLFDNPAGRYSLLVFIDRNISANTPSVAQQACKFIELLLDTIQAEFDARRLNNPEPEGAADTDVQRQHRREGRRVPRGLALRL